VQLRATIIAIIVLSAGLMGLCFRAAVGTPNYAARAGRTCDNCHVTPNQWKNPELAKRKCTLTCQGCHVDPAGGGMRTVSGRYYGRATIPMKATSPRPTADWDRNFPGYGRRDKVTSYSSNLPMGPSTFEESIAWEDSISDGLAWGRPGMSPTEYGFFPGRYYRLNPDPLFRIGLDLRLATLLSGTALIFPMQIDVPMALHPVHHLTVFANTGARGRTSGYSATFESDHSFYFREAFVMLHEAPYQSYLKAGRFVPSYGLRLDDHTSRIRREFELDGALPESRVTGIEAGLAPNYPFLQASWFRMTSRARVPDAWNIFDLDDGWGTAVNGGWRDEFWTLAGSWLMRRRPLDEGGDTDTYGVYGALNFWQRWRGVPLTWQGEYDRGSFQRASGSGADKAAFYQELDWLVYNGVNLLVAHDWADPDREVRDDESHRLQFGLQWTWYPGVTLDGRIRSLLPSGGGSGSDLFLQLHLWI